MTDWEHMALHPGILREPDPQEGRLVLWVPTERDGTYQHWLRVSSVARATMAEHRGLYATPATALRARQPVRRFFGTLLHRFRRAKREDAWLLPNGETAEECGDRQTGLLLVWTGGQGKPLDEAQVRELWPQITRLQSLGPHLCLVWGAAGPVPGSSSEAISLASCSEEQAEQWLDAARRSGDRPKEVSALTDLGLLALARGQVSPAIVRLQEALALARTLGDRALEGDVAGSLGLALLTAHQPGQARPYLERALSLARAAGDRFAEKLTLTRLGTVDAALGNLPAAVTLLTEALTLARALGDRQHEAELLWHLAIRQAEAGQRENALGSGEAAAHLLEELGKPQATVYRKYLDQYRQGNAEPKRREPSTDVVDGSLVMTGETFAEAAPSAERTGPGFLRMAITATKALSRFVGSGFKTVDAQTLQERLRQCAGCSQYTGLRCLVCGCFINLKIRLPHEECPLGRWKPAAACELANHPG